MLQAICNLLAAYGAAAILLGIIFVWIWFDEPKTQPDDIDYESWV